MRRLVLLFIFGIFALLNSCKKNVPQTGRVKPTLIADAETYFNTRILGSVQFQITSDPSNIRKKTSKSVSWESAQQTTFQGKPAVVAAVKYAGNLFYSCGPNTRYRIDLFSRLLMYKDSAKIWHTQLVLFLPDSTFLAAKSQMPSGNLLVEDWWGQTLQQFHYADGKVYQWAQRNQSNTSQKIISSNTPRSAVIITTCTYIEGYNYSPDNPEGGEYWEENVGCVQTLVGEFGIANTGTQYGKIAVLPMGGGGGINPSPTPLLTAPPNDIIKDIANYLHCYSNISHATYQVRICSDQPEPATRTPWAIAPNSGSSSGQNPVNVGL